MLLPEITVLGVDEHNNLAVAAGFGSLGMEWPSELEHKGTTYKFAHNEYMESWMHGRFSGHAIYQLTE